MIVSLRRIVLLASAVLLCLGTPAKALYPEKPITWIVPYPPGGSSDVVSRLITTKLSERMKAKFVVENKPGAAGIIAEEFVARAPADGYTLLYDAFALAINPAMTKDLKFDPAKDFAPITQVSNMWSILVVPANAPYRTFPEFLDYARKNAAKMNFGVSAGSAGHIATEMLKASMKADLLTVAYKGGAPALQAIVAGETSVYFATAGSGMPFIKSGALRPIAVASPSRTAALPDVPTLTELGFPEMIVSEWTGLLAPKGTPDEIVQLLNKELHAVLAEPDVRQQLINNLGIEIVTGTPQEFGKFIQNEMQRWGKVIKEHKISGN